MGMKPVMHEENGPVGNTVTDAHKTGHYDGVANTNTEMKATSGNPNPGGIPTTTTTKGKVPTA